jgi:hypothetical protein
MHLVQLLLPVKADAEEAIAQTREELLERFDGVTAFIRSPARGAWISPGGQAEHDDVIIVEVVVPGLDRAWWRRYRETLEARFSEQEIHVRVIPAEVL